MLIHESECSAGWAPLMVNWLSTLFTPGRLATVFSAMDFCEASATDPVSVTTPSLDSVLMESSFRYVLNTYDFAAEDSMRLSVSDA